MSDSISEAFAAAASGGDVKAIARAVPEIVGASDARAAHGLMKHFNTAWLPEALALFNTRGLLANQKRDMAAAIPAATADNAARIGRYGFSFPQWRFVSQGFGGPALIERYGMTRLTRANDVRDASLPKSNPDRDKFGVGFVKRDGAGSVEYRRTYVLCANDEGALLIRNSSYFFGRDRLPCPAYVSDRALSDDDLRGIDETNLAGLGFKPWHEAPEMQAITCRLLDRLDREDMKLSQWLGTEGLHIIKLMLEKQGKAPFYFAFIDPRMPPWFPIKSFAAKAGVEKEIARNAPYGTKLVLLSGPNGDLPVKPNKPSP